jgi:hypothetical protein
VADEGWEARMAARARERWVRPSDQCPTVLFLGTGLSWREGREHIERTQTLGDALGHYGIDRLDPDRFAPGCACIGPPCCRQWYLNALRLKQAAHIAVKLIVSRMEALNRG